MEVLIVNIDLSKLLAGLWNRAYKEKAEKEKKKGLTPVSMSTKEAETFLLDKKNGRRFFGFVRGLILNVDLSGDIMDTTLYNKKYGEGAAEWVINEIRGRDTRDIA